MRFLLFSTLLFFVQETCAQQKQIFLGTEELKAYIFKQQEISGTAVEGFYTDLALTLENLVPKINRAHKTYHYKPESAATINIRFFLIRNGDGFCRNFAKLQRF